MLSFNSYSFKNKKVLVRVDFNVPVDKEGKIEDLSRVEASWPTLHKILKEGGIAIVCSHLGRPEGVPNSGYSLYPVYEYIKKHLFPNTFFAKDCIGPAVEEQVRQLLPGSLLLLENLRFHTEETENNAHFAQQLASLAEVYVNDAFGTSHRRHASVYAVPLLFKDKMLGQLMQTEVEQVNKLLIRPARPYIALVGGAKIEDKVALLLSLLEKADKVLVGGNLANLLHSVKIEKSLAGTSPATQAQARQVLEKAKRFENKLILPTDIIAQGLNQTKTLSLSDLPPAWQAFDIGPHTQQQFSAALLTAKSILFNGPMGLFEEEKFAGGTRSVVTAIQTATQQGAFSLAGGGNTLHAIQQFGATNYFTHLSTGGGALLHYLAYGALPALEAIQ